ncbi:hypothetical protein DFP73DRAFT_540234 [Morchella snyderi]|nr:hypothetical protein DFP73DRAFT_540234 [Morchella snyderi]
MVSISQSQILKSYNLTHHHQPATHPPYSTLPSNNTTRVISHVPPPSTSEIQKVPTHNPPLPPPQGRTQAPNPAVPAAGPSEIWGDDQARKLLCRLPRAVPFPFRDVHPIDRLPRVGRPQDRQAGRTGRKGETGLLLFGVLPAAFGDGGSTGNGREGGRERQSGRGKRES